MHALETTTISELDDTQRTCATDCFHCGLPVPAGVELSVRIDDAARVMCCAGCQAVAQAIVDAGHSAYYRHRTASAERGELIPDYLERSSVYDHEELQRVFTRPCEHDQREAVLLIEGMTCAACVWLNERHVSSLPGVVAFEINYTTRRARVRWDPQRLQLSRILQAIRDIGYVAHPWAPGNRQSLLDRERKAQLRRLAIAGLLGMQVMVLAVALYAGEWYGIEPQYRTFFRWVSLCLALPLVVYAAQPFFVAAWRDLRRLTPGMDLPVALGVAIAFAGSAYATVLDRGAVYFDSVAMFVFLLLGARYLELAVRNRSAAGVERLAATSPDGAIKLDPETRREEHVPAVGLIPGDHAVVRTGDTVPADGVVTSGEGRVDESLLSGESAPVCKTPGDALVAGSVNLGDQLVMRVERTGAATVLSSILAQVERAHQEKPRTAGLAERIAPWFVAGVLLLAGLSAGYWYAIGSEQWLAITVSVLVVTCPCALSLATPTALAASLGSLLQRGVLVTGGRALETLAVASHFVFDKTGTLTTATPEVVRVEVLADVDERRCRALAAALERFSSHPLAHALRSEEGLSEHADSVHTHPGAGLEGEVAGCRYWLGSPAFVGRAAGASLQETAIPAATTLVALARSGAVLALFHVTNPVRSDAESLMDRLRDQGRSLVLLSGDGERPTREVAQGLGIGVAAWQLSPDQKRARVQALQHEGALVAAVGDGINDAPVLAQAQVAIAMGGGTRLAAITADIVLLHDRLDDLATTLVQALRTRRVIRQNLSWAVLYNLSALPAALLGYVPPWLAALGMSASSLLVVLNAARLHAR